ncbi:MAG TPA: DNA replication/repair protein RecF [Armatimonadaceae bacterium]|nr:DNA replication/repair protein RecF [Armatimonadaceae bacterium]
MRVIRLELSDFRNYSSLHFEPGPGLNILVGPNAQGKSNLLESLYVLATTKSMRAGRDADMVRFGADVCRVVAEVARETSGDVALEMAVGAPGAAGIGVERKLVKINHARQSRVTDLIGSLNAVLFSSVDLDIVRGEPEERRRFLNYEIAQVSPAYVLALGAYRRALEQRNRLLKDVRFGHADSASLDAWTEQIVRHGAKLMERRRAYLDKLAAHAGEVHQALTDGRETLVVEYAPSFGLGDAVTAEEVSAAFDRALAALRRDEMQRGSTLLGPQRDDLVFRVGESAGTAVDARTFGSQGQQRTVALSLRLAERRLIEEMVGEPPVVLLDDVLSDLDERRRAQIFALALSGGQTFLTTTDLGALPEEAVARASVWNVTAGVVAPEQQEPAAAVVAVAEDAPRRTSRAKSRPKPETNETRLSS